MIIHVSLEAPFTYFISNPRWAIEVDPGTTAAALGPIITQTEPMIQRIVPNCSQGSALVLALNGSRVQPSYLLQEGDYVQVFAPVSGG